MAFRLHMTFGTGAIIGLNLDLGLPTVACAAEWSQSSDSRGEPLANSEFKTNRVQQASDVLIFVAADSRKNIRFVMGKSFGVSPISGYGNGSAVAIQLRKECRSTFRFSAISRFSMPYGLPVESTIPESRCLLPADPDLTARADSSPPERFFVRGAESLSMPAQESSA